MTPVEQTKTSWGGRPRRLEVSSTVRREARSPCWPVAQLALPALTTTARMRPLDSARCFFERVTGAATTRFCVKTAAAEAGTSLDKIARSRAPVFFSPQAVAAKRKPRGRDDSERACCMLGRSVTLTRRRKQPPMLRKECGRGSRNDYRKGVLMDQSFRRSLVHGLAPELFLLSRLSKSAIAARTD